MPPIPVKPVIINAETIAAAPPERFPDEKVGGTVHWKTLLSAPDTPTDTFTAGIATCAGSSPSTPSPSTSPSPSSSTSPSKLIPTCAIPSHAGHLKLHRHTHPELYYIISGSGIVTIDSTEHVVEAGSVVFIPGDAEHGVKCTGEEDLRWLYVFCANGFGEIGYRFSGEVRAKL